MDPLVGEACVLAEAMDLACRKKWLREEFECDSLVICKEVLEDGNPSWLVAAMVEKIHRGSANFKDWRIA
ncbi:hypothetical protein CJ030_MR2G016364 [Morella rubra]|uniref:RNase H type-1 domain-containing protein n=1 Tax=Morella rubra TaxID=262757 RepID=A0A6A1WGT3_9ROSI|nr:hypothetical protein CJ030_MR2G016364 [Morella rubra]